MERSTRTALLMLCRGRGSLFSDTRTFLRQAHGYHHEARQLLSVRHFSEDGQGNGQNGVAGRFWEYITGKHAQPRSRNSSEGNAGSDSEQSAGVLVPSKPEDRFRDVLVVPVPRRPLLPGGIMPVTIQNNKLIKELFDLRKQGAQAYVGAFLRRTQNPATAASGDSSPSPLSDDLPGAAQVAAAVESDPAGESDPLSLLHPVGTFAQVHTLVPNEDGAQLLLLGHRRIQSTGMVSKDPLRVSIKHLKDAPYDSSDATLKATTMEIISTLKELLHMHPLYNEQMRNFIQFGADFHDLSRLADLAASLTTADSDHIQQILEELNVPERANQSLLLLKKEVELCKLQADIGKRVEEKISKDQRKYFLMEQLKSIKKELGLEKDEKTALVQKFRERLEPLQEHLPEAASKVIEEELEKLQAIDPASSEFNVTRNYLDWLTSIPWGKFSEEKLDIDSAQQILDEDHYGLKDVKERILEFIAVGRLRGSTQGKILCLVGPPGVGKTSIGRSIARALNRQYYRFSVGGLSDVAEIKGHRRTYVGAMPGKMVQCLKSTGTSNPLVLIDEIDKLGRGYQGDPASALLELLDPEQNSGFLDHYLDVPVDLSKVLFMCTANVLDTIPGPLLDRMEIIRLSGYIFDEKKEIARKYLEPQALHDAGVPRGAVDITPAAMDALIDDYAREAGVRNLKKQLEKVYRKSALKLVQMEVQLPEPQQAQQQRQGRQQAAEDGQQPQQQPVAAEGKAGTGGEGPASPQLPERPPTAAAAEEVSHQPVMDTQITIDVGDLKEYVGQPPYPSDKIYRDGTPVGVVMGLAWTALGGSTLYVEAASVERGEGKGRLHATGQLGDVMKESAQIAHTFARRFLETLPPQTPAHPPPLEGQSGSSSGGGSPSLPPPADPAAFFAEHAIHVHVPAGSTPKDGPSAGCTIITALLSLAMSKPVRPDLAMTGEVTLTGRVLPIGGVKEKALAARRAGVKHILFPEGNRRDWDELTEEVKQGLEPHFVETYDQVYQLAFEV